MLKKVLFFVFVLNTFTSVVCFSQSNILEKKISISIHNKATIFILESIEKKGGFTFSYNNSIFDERKEKSINVNNVSINVILLEILGNQYQWNIFNNQVLISQKPEATIPKTNSLNIKKPEKKQIIDTIKVTIYDTIKKSIIDTQIVKIIDTIKINDTIFITQNYSESIPKQLVQFSIIDAPTVFSKIIFDFKSKYGDIKTFIANSESEYKGNDAGFYIDFSIKKIRFKTGLIQSSLSQKTHYSFDKEYIDNGSIYRDSSLIWQYKTVLYYYKYKNGDTVKIPVIDSSQAYKTFEHQKKNIEHNRTYGTNTFKLIQIPISVGYPIQLNKRNTLTPFFSSRFYFLISENGYSYNYRSNNIDKLSRSNVSQFFIATSLSFQYEHKINNESIVFIEPILNQFVTPVYSDKRIVNQRLFQCSIAFGLRTVLFTKK